MGRGHVNVLSVMEELEHKPWCPKLSSFIVGRPMFLEFAWVKNSSVWKGKSCADLVKMSQMEWEGMLVLAKYEERVNVVSVEMLVNQSVSLANLIYFEICF